MLRTSLSLAQLVEFDAAIQLDADYDELSFRMTKTWVELELWDILELVATCGANLYQLIEQRFGEYEVALAYIDTLLVA